MTIQIFQGDCRDVLIMIPDQSINCVVTSPPYYGLRNYGVVGQIGLEQTPDEYVEQLVSVFREVRRVLRDDGTLWLNLGDSYANKNNHGVKPKNLIGIPWRVAFALQADGWFLRQDIIWSKPNAMPESVNDRCTKAHEYVFHMNKSAQYWYDAKAIYEDAMMTSWATRTRLLGKREKQGPKSLAPEYMGQLQKVTSDPSKRNRRSVWMIATQPNKEAHFAMMPPALAELCIKAGCPQGGTVLDPFGGVGTTGLVAEKLSRNSILIELNPEYVETIYNRMAVLTDTVNGGDER